MNMTKAAQSLEWKLMVLNKFLRLMKQYEKSKDTHRLVNTPCYNKMETLKIQLETFQADKLMLSDSSLINWKDSNILIHKK